MGGWGEQVNQHFADRRSFLIEYARMGSDDKSKAEERLRTLAATAKRIAGEIRDTYPEAQDARTFISKFRDRWLDYFATLFRGTVCRLPPMSEARALTVWIALRTTTMAGLELMLMSQENADQRRAASGLDDLSPHLGPQQRARLEGLRAELGSTGLIEIEELLMSTEKSLDEDAAKLLAVLPAESNADQPPTNEAANSLLDSLGTNVPVTSAVAWRMVVELERCRQSSADDIGQELHRLSQDPTWSIHRYWTGMMQIASDLWSVCRPQIEAQASREGMIEAAPAELNTKRHLMDLNDILDAEVPAVLRIYGALA